MYIEREREREREMFKACAEVRHACAARLPCVAASAASPAPPHPDRFHQSIAIRLHIA